MVVKKPLANYSGKIDELHSGDIISGDTGHFTGTNQNASPITKGFIVYKKSTAADVDLANATDDTKNAIGFVEDASIANGASGSIQTAETISLSDWTSIIGTTNLTPGAFYYLDTTAGKMTTTAPSVSGNITQKLGQAVSTTEFLIIIEPRILLA